MVRLTAAQKQFYKDNGYIMLKGAFTPSEMNKLSERYDVLFNSKNPRVMENSWQGSNETNRITDSPYTVKGIHNLHHHDATFGNALYNENLLDAVADCLGTENIALHHTKAHLKPPEKGAVYPMHQDYHYFPYDKHGCVAAFIHLDDAYPENGCLYVYPGSHKLGPQEDVGKLEGNFHYVDNKKFPLEKAVPVRAERGDVVIFSYLLIHGSPQNTSNNPRRMYLAQFFDPSHKPVGTWPRNPSYGWMLRGVNANKDASIANQYAFD
ncbi:hypothetical protein ABMA28_009561 [Loxostege sticticalis]|uniref:phytanoyl-CoA dioxygenase n=1 Tax=Loxostege sticticalis TaxID=481309 RepID=A0ABD0SDQ1_LOXSC